MSALQTNEIDEDRAHLESQRRRRRAEQERNEMPGVDADSPPGKTGVIGKRPDADGQEGDSFIHGMAEFYDHAFSPTHGKMVDSFVIRKHRVGVGSEAIVNLVPASEGARIRHGMTASRQSIKLQGRGDGPRAALMIRMAQAKGLTSVHLTGSREFKMLLAQECYRAGIDVQNKELRGYMVALEKNMPDQKGVNAEQSKTLDEIRVTEPPVTAAATLASRIRDVTHLFAQAALPAVRVQMAGVLAGLVVKASQESRDQLVLNGLSLGTEQDSSPGDAMKELSDSLREIPWDSVSPGAKSPLRADLPSGIDFVAAVNSLCLAGDPATQGITDEDIGSAPLAEDQRACLAAMLGLAKDAVQAKKQFDLAAGPQPGDFSRASKAVEAAQEVRHVLDKAREVAALGDRHQDSAAILASVAGGHAFNMEQCAMRLSDYLVTSEFGRHLGKEAGLENFIKIQAARAEKEGVNPLVEELQEEMETDQDFSQ